MHTTPPPHAAVVTATATAPRRDASVCDIPLSHATASRQHAVLCHHTDGRVFLIDLGSSHGTFLDGAQLPPNKPVVLKSGSSIRFGQGPTKFVMRDVESAGAWRAECGAGMCSCRSPCGGFDAAGCGHDTLMTCWATKWSKDNVAVLAVALVGLRH
jgi:hypothetical protein